MKNFIKWRGGFLGIALLMMTPPMRGDENKPSSPTIENQAKLSRSRQEIHEERIFRSATIMMRQLSRMSKKPSHPELEGFYAQAAEVCRLESEYLDPDYSSLSKSRRSLSSVERGRHDNIMELLVETREAAKLALNLFEDGRVKAATFKVNQAEKSLKQAMHHMEDRRKTNAKSKADEPTNTREQTRARPADTQDPE